jgi:hypothetical protein
MAGLIPFAMMAVVIASAAVWRGLILSFLWLWFLVPIGVPAIGAVHGAGIALLAGMFLTSVQKKQEQKGRHPAAVLFEDIVATPLLILALGAIVHAFM